MLACRRHQCCRWISGPRHVPLAALDETTPLSGPPGRRLRRPRVWCRALRLRLGINRTPLRQVWTRYAPRQPFGRWSVSCRLFSGASSA